MTKHWAVLWLVCLWGTAFSSVQSAEKRVLVGDYATALRLLKGDQSAAADNVRLAVYKETGELAQWDQITRRLPPGPESAIERARYLRRVGRPAEGLALLQKHPLSHFGVRFWVGRLQFETGARAAGKKTMRLFFDDYNAGRIDENNPSQLYFVAQAARYLESHQDAQDMFQKAVDLAPDFFEANIEWGYLYLEKYTAAYAEQSFTEVLAKNPHHADALAGLAKTRLEQRYDVEAAFKLTDKALKTDPTHHHALLVRAGLQVDRNEWDAAQKTIHKILQTNPSHLEALSLKATIAWLRDNTTEYKRLRNQVLSRNPSYAEFFHIVARSAVREHRYVQAVALEKEALAIRPDYYAAMQAVGSGYLRLGDEKEGLKWLNKAWDGDQYNVRTYNLLNLFEETIHRKYTKFSTKNFVFQVHRDEKEIIERMVAPMMERAFDKMVARYGFKPKTPLIIELYQSPQNWSIRTIGLPDFGALGVCFGQVITARSPVSGKMNWGMVLWHELAHVFHIQMSKSRVPRWYTEGLSEYETMVAKPEWFRENDAVLAEALAKNELPGVVELNYHFVRPSSKSVSMAYYLSAVTMQYIADRYGFDRVVRGLKLFSQGKETKEVVEWITGKNVDAFNQEFRNHLRKRLNNYRVLDWLPNAGELGPPAALQKTASETKRAEDWSKLAMVHFYAGNAPAAQKAADQAIQIDPKDKVALYILAELAFVKKEFSNAESLYHRLVQSGGDGWETRMRMGAIAEAKDDLTAAENHYCIARTMRPDQARTHSVLYELFKKQNKKQKALEALETYVMLDNMTYGPIVELIEELKKEKLWNKLRYYGQFALEISPGDTTMLETVADAHLQTKDATRAIELYDVVLATNPRRPALLEVKKARALLQIGDKAKAKKALEKALIFEPNLQEALTLQKNL